MIAVAGGKGGCGKTTTTACLARALAGIGARPLAVDADRDMPDLHEVAGAQLNPGLDALSAGRPLAEVTQSPVQLPGVGLVAAGEPADGRIQTALERVKGQDDPVLVDTPAGASPDVALPLRVADAVVVVTTPTRQSLTDAAKTAAMARALDATVLGAVVTHSDGSVTPDPLLQCEVLTHAPAVDDPLGSETVSTAYESVARMITKRNI